MPFTRATKLAAKLRLALAALSGAGKTYTALQLATHLVHFQETFWGIARGS